MLKKFRYPNRNDFLNSHKLSNQILFWQTIFSSGKSLEAVALAVLHNKGLFEYNDKVTKYWPEFGQNGKEEITIADVCQHRAGLANFSESPSIKDAWTDHIKQNRLGALIEGASQKLASPARCWHTSAMVMSSLPF